MNEGREATERRHVVALENDLFFAVKIQDTLNRAGFQTRVTRTVAEFRERLAEGSYALVLVNTAARGLDWRTGIAAAREMGIPAIAYGPHVDLDTQAEARTAGAARVIANSRLAELPAIIERVLIHASGQASPINQATCDSSVPNDDEQSGE